MENRIKKLEENQEKTNQTLYEVKAIVNAIEKYVSEAISNGKSTIKHEQQIVSLEARVRILEQNKDEMRKEIASINLKIASVSWAYAVVIFLLNKFL